MAQKGNFILKAENLNVFRGGVDGGKKWNFWVPCECRRSCICGAMCRLRCEDAGELFCEGFRYGLEV